MRPDLAKLLEPMESVVLVRLAEDGTVRHGNAGFHRLAADAAVPAWRLFSQPRFKDLAAQAPDADGVVYRGQLTLGDPVGSMQTLHGTVLREGDELMLVAGYDIGELERLPTRLIELNSELDQMQRALVRTNRQLEAREAEIREMALTDSLTSIGNRRYLDELLLAEVARAERYGQPFSLALLDLDRFKKVNDEYGHEAGDEVLKATARTLRDNLRQSDLLARFGGEEFVILMPALGLDEARAGAERLRGILAASRVEGLPQVTASFGVACLRAGETTEELLARADEAMYRAKEAGRNRVEVSD